MEVNLKTFRPEEPSVLFVGRQEGFHIMRKPDKVDYRNWKETLDQAGLKPVCLEDVLSTLLQEDFQLVRYRMWGLAFYVVGGDGNSVINYSDPRTRGIFRILTDRGGSIIGIRRIDSVVKTDNEEKPEQMVSINGNNTRPLVLSIMEKDDSKYRFALTDDSIMPSMVNCLVGVPKTESKARVVDLLRK